MSSWPLKEGQMTDVVGNETVNFSVIAWNPSPTGEKALGISLLLVSNSWRYSSVKGVAALNHTGWP